MDIHTPTVPSGPTTGSAANGIPKDKLTLKGLMSEMDRLEAELKALSAVLDSVRLLVNRFSLQCQQNH